MMRRRQAFTLVELLVAMALIMFIMAILSTAFVEATNTFRNLKATGDMAEKLRATTQLLQRDLSADHFDGKRRMSNSNFWLNGPPEQGYLQIWQGPAGSIDEGADVPAGVHSFRSVDHALAFTIKMRGNQMGDFPSASAAGGGALLSPIQSFGPTESRYQVTSGGAYNYQWAEVAWYLAPSINPVTGQQDNAGVDPVSGQTVPLWILYRRQRLAVPDNSLVTQASTPPGGIPNAQAVNCLELSCWPNNTSGFLYFNSPIDLTVPQRRFGGDMTGGFYPTLPVYQGQTLTAQGAPPSLAGADMQLTDVVSFDVRVLAQGVAVGAADPFVTLSSLVAPTGPYTYTTPSMPPGTQGIVFDTWSSVNDGLSNYSQWNVAGGPTPVPLWDFNAQTGPIILAIQISLRIWDLKTNQTRQVTIVQAM